MDPHLIQGAFWKGQTQLLAGLQGRIKEYLAYVSTARDSVALELLKETAELLNTQKEIDNSRAKMPNLKDTLNAIQLSLIRIEQKESIAPVSRNYATVATVAAQNSLKSPEALLMPLSRKDPKYKQVTKNNKAPTPRETRWAQEITVHIGDAADKEKIKMLSTKDLVEALQVEAEGIQGVSCLISNDIKIYAESTEAKKALEKKTEWTQKMVRSAAIQERTFSVRANNIRIENINVANQAKAIEGIQIANSCLHLGLKIAKLAWSARAIREKKIYFTLHIEVATAAMAN